MRSRFRSNNCSIRIRSPRRSGWPASIAPFRLASLRDLRFIGVAYIALFVAAVLLGAKGYYIVGIYAALLAIGAVAIERAAALAAVRA